MERKKGINSRDKIREQQRIFPFYVEIWYVEGR